MWEVSMKILGVPVSQRGRKVALFGIILFLLLYNAVAFAAFFAFMFIMDVIEVPQKLLSLFDAHVKRRLDAVFGHDHPLD
jgi:hypothetical protein